MDETGWQAIGRIARERRERLGLNQDQLASYGGPRVATVGKFERGTQGSFPLRTQHQVENALGWSRGVVEQVVKSIDEGTLAAEDWEHDLVEEGLPDLSRPNVAPPGEGGTIEAVDTFLSVFRLVAPPRQDEALRAALVAIIPYLDVDGASRLGRGLRAAFPLDGGESDAENSSATIEPDDA